MRHPRCSICKSTPVHFQKIGSWETLEYYRGKSVAVKNIAMMRYCKECFYEYGGTSEKSF